MSFKDKMQFELCILRDAKEFHDKKFNPSTPRNIMVLKHFLQYWSLFRGTNVDSRIPLTKPWYWSEQIMKKTVGLSVILNAMTPILRQCNESCRSYQMQIVCVHSGFSDFHSCRTEQHPGYICMHCKEDKTRFARRNKHLCEPPNNTFSARVQATREMQVIWAPYCDLIFHTMHELHSSPWVNWVHIGHRQGIPIWICIYIYIYIYIQTYIHT